MRFGVGVFLLGSAGIVLAQQQPFWEPEVRRALPVEKPSPTPIQAPRAIPVYPVADPSFPASGSTSGESGLDGAHPTFTVAGGHAASEGQSKPAAGPHSGRPDESPGSACQGAASGCDTASCGNTSASSLPQLESGDIRLSPSTATGEQAAEEELNLANTTYSRKMYDYAIQGYEKFLITYPTAKGRDIALFRLAECHRMLGNEEAARAGYERLLREFREGEFAGAAAYRLGEYLFAEKKYDPALIQFQLAAREAANDEVRLSAKYNIARSLDRLKRPEEATKYYAEVAAVEKNNPYLQYARLSLAENAASAGRKRRLWKASPRSPTARHPSACAPRRRSKRPPWRQSSTTNSARSSFSMSF